MKILYAASNNANSKIQLSRFLKAMIGTPHQIKIAAYKVSSPKNVNIDWTLDALLNINDRNYISLLNDNLNIYFDQVKSYAPDLIISDLEYFTSYVANSLNIITWQCSAALIKFALTHEEKKTLGLFKFYAHLLNRDPEHTQRTVNLIDNSSRNFIYSHYGDLDDVPNIEGNFEWIRPYHQKYKPYVLCQHNVVAAIYNDKRLINELKKYSDSIIFIDGCVEKYENILMKPDIEYNEDEYYCNLGNSKHFVCQGQTSFLADAFYNERFSYIWPNFTDIDSIINLQLAQRTKIGAKIMVPIDFSGPGNVKSNYKNNIKYLHEKIEEF